MTSALLSGYVALGNGRRVPSTNPTTKKATNYVFYDSVIQTMGVDIPLEIRIWQPSQEPILPDNTVIDVLGKIYAPPNATVQLDIIHYAAFPGDPADDSYEDSIPDRPFPTLYIIGHTVGSADAVDDTGSIGYTVQASDYVRDQARSSRFCCRFDAEKPRWKNTPRPQSGSAVQVVGFAYGVHLPTGHLMIDVDHLQLNIGSSSASSSPARVETGGTPTKRRRFAAASDDAGPSSSSSHDKTAAETSAVNGANLIDDEAEEVPDASGNGAKKAGPAKRKIGGRRG